MNQSKTKRKKPRKKRLDSAQERAKIVRAATKKLVAPPLVPLSDRGHAFFEAILAEAPKIYWTQHKLIFAAQLADLQDRLELMKREVDERGNLIDSERETRSGHIATTTEKNPLLGEIAKLTGVIIAARRSLALHAIGQAGNGRTAGKRLGDGKAIENAALADSENGAGQDDGDELIMRPN